MRICIVSPSQNFYSETFIQAHKKFLPGVVDYLYGSYFPVFAEGDRLLLPIIHQTVNTFLARKMGLDFSYMNRILMKKYPKSLKESALARHLRKTGIQVVLAEYAQTGVEIMDVCNRQEIPLVVYFHGPELYRSVLAEYGDRYPELFKKSAALIVVSTEMKNKLISLGAPLDKIFLNPCGVDTQFFKKPSNQPPNPLPVFVSVGRFVAFKAPHLTILAFKQVFEKHPEARLIMVGNGPLLEACEQMLRALKLKDAVDLRGTTSPAEVRDIMASAFAFVHHAMVTMDDAKEGTPVAVLEAGAMGLPVISTRHSGIAEAIVEGHTGYLVDEGDVDSMAERMIQLIENRELALNMGQAARERIESEYSMNRRISCLTKIIEQASHSQISHQKS